MRVTFRLFVPDNRSRHLRLFDRHAFPDTQLAWKRKALRQPEDRVFRSGDIQILRRVEQLDLELGIVQSSGLGYAFLGRPPPLSGRFDFRILLEGLGNQGIDAKWFRRWRGFSRQDSPAEAYGTNRYCNEHVMTCAHGADLQSQKDN